MFPFLSRPTPGVTDDAQMLYSAVTFCYMAYVIQWPGEKRNFPVCFLILPSTQPVDRPLQRNVSADTLDRLTFVSHVLTFTLFLLVPCCRFGKYTFRGKQRQKPVSHILVTRW